VGIPTRERAERLVLRARRVLPSSDAEIIHDAAILVCDSTIEYVGPRDGLDGASTREVDLGDATLMPGLFDCHVHLSFDGDINGDGAPADDARLAVVMARNAQLLLNAGVTTARDLGSASTVAPTVRDAISERLIPGPRLQVANAPLTVTGGHAWRLGGEADGVDAIQRKVRQLRKTGADILKIMTTGGFMTAGSRPWERRFSEPELAAACDEAHRLGMRVTTHAQSVEGVRAAVQAGVDSIEHCAWVTRDGIRFDSDVAALIASGGVPVCPTMNAACVADAYFCPWGPRQQVIENLRRMRESGITLIAGTDCGIPLVPADAYFDGLAVMAESGMSTREVIRSATTDAAAACGLGEETGALTVGRAADIIGVRGDPTVDIAAMREPVLVMARGMLRHITPPRQLRTPDYHAQAQRLQQRLHRDSGRAPSALQPC